MSGEKRAAGDLSWEFTAGLVRGILIGSGIVLDRSCVGGRRAPRWEWAEGGVGEDDEERMGGAAFIFYFLGGTMGEESQSWTGRPYLLLKRLPAVRFPSFKLTCFNWMTTFKVSF